MSFKLFDVVSIETLSNELDSKIDILDVIALEDAFSDVELIGNELQRYCNIISSTEEAIQILNVSAEMERCILDTNEVISKEHLDLSINVIKNIHSLVGSKFDSNKILSIEDYKAALTLSMEAKLRSGKWFLDILIEVYDKIRNYIKKLFIKGLVYFNKIKETAKNLLVSLASNRSKASSTIEIKDKLEDKLISKYGAILYGFSNGKINEEFFKNVINDFNDTTIFDDHKTAIHRIILTSIGIYTKYEENLNQVIDNETIEVVKKAYEAEKNTIIKPFRYFSDSYKSLSVEKFDLKAGTTALDFFNTTLGTAIKIKSTKVDVSKYKGRFNVVEFDVLSKMVELIINESDKIKTFQTSLETKTESILKDVEKIVETSFDPKEAEQIKFLLPATNYAKTVMSTIVVEKTIGYIYGLKDMLNIVGMLSTMALKDSKGPNVDPNQLMLENKK